MIVEFEGQEYQLDIEGMDLIESRYIFNQTGLGIIGLFEGLVAMEPMALSAIYWLMLKQTHGAVKDLKRLEFKPFLFGKAVIEAIAKEKGLDEDGEPTEAPDEEIVPKDSETS